jgi:hypothetical protein
VYTKETTTTIMKRKSKRALFLKAAKRRKLEKIRRTEETITPTREPVWNLFHSLSSSRGSHEVI